jgi:hypothetical protein
MTFKIYAGPASPYSQKVRGVFRYRRIPHTWLVPMGGFHGIQYPRQRHSHGFNALESSQ